jgi:hypothetical protein
VRALRAQSFCHVQGPQNPAYANLHLSHLFLDVPILSLVFRRMHVVLRVLQEGLQDRQTVEVRLSSSRLPCLPPICFCSCVTISNLFHARSIDRVFKPHHPNLFARLEYSVGPHSDCRAKASGPAGRNPSTCIVSAVHIRVFNDLRDPRWGLTAYSNFNDWLKHNHTNASPCHPIRRRIHASKSFRTPIIQIKVQQAISGSELCARKSSTNKIKKHFRYSHVTFRSCRNIGLSISVSALKTSNLAWSAKTIASPMSSVNRRFNSPCSSAFSTKAVSVA